MKQVELADKSSSNSKKHTRINRLILIMVPLLLIFGVGYFSWRQIQLYVAQQLIHDCVEQHNCADNISAYPLSEQITFLSEQYCPISDFLSSFTIVLKYHSVPEAMKYVIVKATKYYQKNTINQWTAKPSQALRLNNFNYAVAITDKFGGEILPVEEAWG